MDGHKVTAASDNFTARRRTGKRHDMAASRLQPAQPHVLPGDGERHCRSGGACRRELSVGGLTLVIVTSPGVVMRASGGQALSELDGLAGARLGRLAGAGLDGAGLDGAGLDGAGLDGAGLDGAGLDGAGLAGAGLGGLAEAELSRLEFAVVDLETTGWSPQAAAITEIGAVRVRGARAAAGGRRPGEFVRHGEFASLVNPGTPVPPGIADLTGITDWMLAAAPRLPAVLPGLLEFARGCVLVAHNAPFDLGFLLAGCRGCGLAWPGFTVLDTVMLARRVLDPDEVPDCKLGTLAAYFGARTAPSHRALADARATADVLGWLIRRLAHRGIWTLRQLSAWPGVVAPDVVS
jgi:DNA polymerase III epsilon subunit-like protein